MANSFDDLLVAFHAQSRHLSDSIEPRVGAFVCNSAAEPMQTQKFQKCLRHNINLNLGAAQLSRPSVAVELQQFAPTLLRGALGSGATSTTGTGFKNEEVDARHCKSRRARRGGACGCG
jgi:hypothetical protein